MILFLSVFLSALSICSGRTISEPSLSASSPANRKSSNARLASPCSRAAYAEHLGITSSLRTFSLNPKRALSWRISWICIAL